MGGRVTPQTSTGARKASVDTDTPGRVDQSPSQTGAQGLTAQLEGCVPGKRSRRFQEVHSNSRVSLGAGGGLGNGSSEVVREARAGWDTIEMTFFLITAASWIDCQMAPF